MTNRFATYAMAEKTTFKNALISIRNRGTNLARDTHRACIAAMLYSLVPELGGSKNADPALRLCQHIADGMPRNKVVLWFHYFTNVRVTIKTGADGAVTWSVKNLSPMKKDGSPNADYKELTEDMVQKAIDTPYWKLNPEPDVAPVDIERLISNAIKKIDKARADGKLVADPRNESRIAGLKALIGGGTLAAPVQGRSVPKKSAVGAKAVGAKAGKVVAKA
jgi:hypothetical protein